MPDGKTEAALPVLRHRPFRIYFIGQAISLIGMWMQQVGQGIVVVNLAPSKAAFAVTSVCASVPMALLALHGGAVADRFDRRRILMATQVGLALVAFAYAALLFSGNLTMGYVYVLAAVWGLVAAFDLPAQQALVPDLVPTAKIGQAVALNQSLFHGARLLGPSLGTALIAVTSEPAVFVANGVSYFAVVYSLAVIAGDSPAAVKDRAPITSTALSEGLRYIRSTAVTRALIGFTFLSTALVFPLLIVLLALAVEEFYGNARQLLGPVMAASGLGAMSGALWLLRVRPEERGRVMVVACVLVAVLVVAFSFSHEPWTGAVVVAALTFGTSLAMGLATMIIQITVPDHLRGRVMSIHALGFTAVTPLAALLLGFVADKIGLRTTLRLMGATYLVSALPWLLRARLWQKA